LIDKGDTSNREGDIRLSKNKDRRKKGSSPGLNTRPFSKGATAMEIDKERNRMALERISFHLDEAMRFYNQLDLSGHGPLEQREWDNRMKTCKNAIEFTKESVQKLSKTLE
jgi:hypothetical protein